MKPLELVIEAWSQDLETAATSLYIYPDDLYLNLFNMYNTGLDEFTTAPISIL